MNGKVDFGQNGKSQNEYNKAFSLCFRNSAAAEFELGTLRTRRNIERYWGREREGGSGRRERGDEEEEMKKREEEKKETEKR